MKSFYYLLTILLFFESNIIADDFITAINNKDNDFGFGHWVIYEMNVGAFTADGTFNAAKDRLQDLKDLGIDIIWLMPIYERDGGLDGGKNSPYAAKNFTKPNPNYGTLEDLQNFVREAHELKMQVWLDFGSIGWLLIQQTIISG